MPKPRILDLAQGGYISRIEPVILIGNPGLGKTHVATGLAVAACRQGRRVRFYNVAGLVNDLIKAQQEYRLSRFMTQVTKHELIVLDELGFIPFTATGAQLLFQLCSALYERVALIVTTNLRFADYLLEWDVLACLTQPTCKAWPLADQRFVTDFNGGRPGDLVCCQQAGRNEGSGNLL